MRALQASMVVRSVDSQTLFHLGILNYSMGTISFSAWAGDVVTYWTSALAIIVSLKRLAELGRRPLDRLRQAVRVRG